MRDLLDARKMPGGPPLGFVLVTHTVPEQTAFLCWKLNRLFDAPPIAIHHDYSKCHLDPAQLPPQVKIVQNWTETAWGAFNLVDAYLRALRLLHQEQGPEWTISLSAADYPVKAAAQIVRELQESNADAWFDYREIRQGGTEPADARSYAETYKTPEWMAEACGRYLSYSVLHYHLRRLIRRQNRPIYVSNALITRYLTPFRKDFRPYGGDAWHAVNRRAAAALLEDTREAQALSRFYRKRIVPDESYLHTILLNRPELRVENDNRRYAIWIGDAPHPKTLEAADIPTIVSSRAHFARKFPFDPQLYETVDREVAAAESQEQRSWAEGRHDPTEEGRHSPQAEVPWQQGR